MKLLNRYEGPEILLLPAWDVSAEIRRSIERIMLGVKGWAAAIEESSRTVEENMRSMVEFGDAARQAKFEYRISRVRRLAHRLFGGFIK